MEYCSASLARVAKLIRLSVVFDTKAGFSDIVFHDAQVGIGKREIRVQFNGMFEKRNRRVRPFCVDSLNTRTKSLQGLKRRRRGLFQRSIKLLHCAQRLAQFIPKIDRHFSQRFEHMVLIARLRFRARQRLPLSQLTALSVRR